MEYSGQTTQILYVISNIIYFVLLLLFDIKKLYVLFYPMITAIVLSLALFVPNQLLNNFLFILSSNDLLGLPAEIII